MKAHILFILHFQTCSIEIHQPSQLLSVVATLLYSNPVNYCSILSHKA